MIDLTLPIYLEYERETQPWLLPFLKEHDFRLFKYRFSKPNWETYKCTHCGFKIDQKKPKTTLNHQYLQVKRGQRFICLNESERTIKDIIT